MEYILNHIKHLEEFLNSSDDFKKYLPEIKKNIRNRKTKIYSLSVHELETLKDTDRLFAQLPDEISDNASIEKIQEKLDSLSRADFFINSLIKVVISYWSLRLNETSSEYIIRFFTLASKKYGLTRYPNGDPADIDRQKKVRGLLSGNDDDWEYLSIFPKTNITQINYLNNKEKKSLKAVINIYDILKWEQESLSVLLFHLSEYIGSIITCGSEKLIEGLDRKFFKIKPMYPLPDSEPNWLSRFPLFKKNIDDYSRRIVESEKHNFKDSMTCELNKGFPWIDLKKNLKSGDRIGISREYSSVFDEIEKMSGMLNQGKYKLDYFISLQDIFLKDGRFADKGFGNDVLLLKELNLKEDRFNEKELKAFNYWNGASDPLKSVLTLSYNRFEYEACEKDLIQNPHKLAIDEGKFPVLYSIQMLLLSPTLDQLHEKNIPFEIFSEENISGDVGEKIQNHFRSLLGADIKNKKIETIISDWGKIPEICLNDESKKRINLLKVVFAFNKNEIDFFALIQRIPGDMQGEITKFLDRQAYQQINNSELSSFAEYDIKKLILFYASYVNFLGDNLSIDYFIEFSIRLSFFGEDCLENLKIGLAGDLKRVIISTIQIVSAGISDKEKFALNLEYIADNDYAAAKKMVFSVIGDRKISESIKNEIQSAHSAGYLRKLIKFMEQADVEVKSHDWPVSIIEKHNASIEQVNGIYNDDIIPWLKGQKSCIHALRNIPELNISEDERWFIEKKMPEKGGSLSCINRRYEDLIHHIPEAEKVLSNRRKNKRLNADTLKRLMGLFDILSSAYCMNRCKLGDSRIIASLFHLIQKRYFFFIRHYYALYEWEEFIEGGNINNIDEKIDVFAMDPSYFKSSDRWIKIRKSELKSESLESEDNIYRIFFSSGAIDSARKILAIDDKILGRLKEYINIKNKLNGVEWFGSQFRSEDERQKIHSYKNEIAMKVADIKKNIAARMKVAT